MRSAVQGEVVGEVEMEVAGEGDVATDIVWPRVVTAIPGRRQGEGCAHAVSALPARHEASFRQMTAGKRHHSPSRITPKALSARCFFGGPGCRNLPGRFKHVAAKTFAGGETCTIRFACQAF